MSGAWSRVQVFVAVFLISVATLFATWIAVDSLVKLDEFRRMSGPDRSWLSVAVLHYQGVVRLQSLPLFGSVALASAAFGGVAVLRFMIPRSRTIG